MPTAATCSPSTSPTCRRWSEDRQVGVTIGIVFGGEGSRMTRYPADGDGISPSGMTATVRERILATYLERLAELRSPIVDNPAWLDQARHQAEAVLDDLALADLSVVTTGFDRSSLAMD